MVDRTKQCKLSHEMMIRLNNFLYVFNLRQGTILIAVHQIVSGIFISRYYLCQYGALWIGFFSINNCFPGAIILCSHNIISWHISCGRNAIDAPRGHGR